MAEEQVHLPLEYIEITTGGGHTVYLDASILLEGSIKHDVDEGLVSVTFLGVRHLTTHYKYMVGPNG